MKDFTFDLQRFADTTIPQSLVLKAWAKKAYESGIHDSFFSRFMGTDSRAIVHRKEDLSKGSGTKINIPLLLPLAGAGILGDNILEGNEEALTYRDFEVELSRVRQAVRLEGEFEEQKTQIDMRRDARTALSAWLAKYVDTSIFGVLTGVRPSWATTAAQFPFPLSAPSTNRVVFGGTATAESGITTADKFSADLIGIAKRKATANEDTAIRPVNVDGHNTYCMVISPQQARDLRNDTKWIEAQKHANIRGEKNPIFSGAMGIYEGVVIHEHSRVPVTASGSSGLNVGHALFLGAQAVTFAEGTAPTWREKLFDYDNKFGASIGRMFGVAKSAFKFDGTNLEDFGVVNVMTAAEND